MKRNKQVAEETTFLHYLYKDIQYSLLFENRCKVKE